MDVDSYRLSTGYQPGSPRERAVSATLSIGIIVIVVLLAIYQAVAPPALVPNSRTVSFDVASNDPKKAANTSQPKPKSPQVATKAQERPVSRPKPLITIQKQVESPDADDGIPGLIKLSRADMAASDIGKMKGRTKGSTNDGRGNDSRLAQGPGEGPGGVTLYDADWYRRPTDAELATYMPQKGGLEGWGLIACQTIDRYHVDNCQILGESPRGSGFGRAVQNAAWQFLVRPPRIDDKPQVGAWVRIRIDYTVNKAG